MSLERGQCHSCTSQRIQKNTKCGFSSTGSYIVIVSYLFRCSQPFIKSEYESAIVQLDNNIKIIIGIAFSWWCKTSCTTLFDLRQLNEMNHLQLEPVQGTLRSITGQHNNIGGHCM